MITFTDVAKRAEFAAKVNGETVGEMQRRYRAEFSELHRALGRARKLADEVHATLANSVVTIADGTSATLFELFEDAHTESYSTTRALCSLCRESVCINEECRS